MLVVIGGHSRNVGKTSVVCNIIRELRDWRWTAIKITQYGHGICSTAGEPCECSDPLHPVAVSEERGALPGTDSARFLEAGADRAWWVRTQGGELVEALPKLRGLIAGAGNVILESNSVLRFLKPDLCAMVMDGAVTDFKETSLRFLDRADMLVATSASPLAWPQVPQALLRSKPCFLALPPSYGNPDFIEAILHSRLKKNLKLADTLSR